MDQTPPTTYALLGLLGVRPWTGYELTNQLRRSLHFVWPSSEGHLYREQKRLIALGWARVSREPIGRRHRNRYEITEAGREALRAWLATDPGPPRLEIEGLVRIFFADQGDIADMARSIAVTRDLTRSLLDSLLDIASEYLEPGGPLEMLESGAADDVLRGDLTFHGRRQFPQRLHVVAVVIDVTTRLLAEMDRSLAEAAAEVESWPSPTDSRITPLTRARLMRIRQRGAERGHG